MKSKFVQYYVEGEDEEKLVNVLKSKMKLIRPGKVQKLNVVEQEISDARLRTLTPGTMVVLIFDTDTGKTDILQRNLEKLNAMRLRGRSIVSEIVTIPQVFNIETELVCCCRIRNATELLNSQSVKDFKRDFRRISNLDAKLLEHGFDIEKLWSQHTKATYDHIENMSEQIKLTAKF